MIPLPASVLFAYTVAPGATATLAVADGGPVEYSGPSALGAFGDVVGTIAAGDSVDVTTPGMLRAKADAHVEITYAVPDMVLPDPDDLTDGQTPPTDSGGK